MAVDAGKCRADCTDCFTACHNVHNVPDIGNPKEEVKWIWPERFEHVFHAESHARIPEVMRTRPVPILCNHCDNPPCVRVCPTGATWRRPDGIVMMDSHRCIGCKICLAACPYGARSINFRNPRPFIARLNPDYPTRSKGVIEKCNFCEERLAKGILPACVMACQEKALVFGDVEDPKSEVRQLLDRKFTIRRRAELGTKPQVYYIL
jgi:molybdopterin-containing oxidoreductase family iron-sulfur binding subunit